MQDLYTRIFEKDENGNLTTEQSILDHETEGQIPHCPKCMGGWGGKIDPIRMKFAKISEDRVEGDLMGTHYQCNLCKTKLLVIND